MLFVVEYNEWRTSVCLLVCFLEFIVQLENFSLIWRRHYCRWRAANFNLCSALMAIGQWGFFSVRHLLGHGTSVIMVISEDPWHSYLLPSVWQWSFHYLFLGLSRPGIQPRSHEHEANALSPGQCAN